MDQPYPAITYTSRDYASLRQAMIDGIAARIPEWTSRSPQDFGIALIELFASMGDILSFYTDRVANEAFLPTATQRDSVLKLAAALNYRPRGTVASKAVVRFTVVGNQAFTIPAGTLLRAGTDSGDVPVVFSVDTDVQVLPSVGGAPQNIDALVTQGQYIVQEPIGDSTGRVDQSFVLRQTPVVESSLLIQVQEGPQTSTWTFIDRIIDARPDENVYTTSIDANGALTVLFGDGLNGRVPPASAQVLASYRIGGGAAGNVASNQITEMVDPISGVLSLTNLSAAYGGADIESTDSIRVNAPRSIQAVNRAVTLEDYASLALQVPQVAKARAEAAVYSNVVIYVAPFDGGTPSNRTLSDVVNFMASRKMVGVEVLAATPSYVPINVTVEVTVDPAYVKNQVRGDVEVALADLLAFGNVDFADRISVARVYDALTNVPGHTLIEISKLSKGTEGGVSDVILGDNEIPTSGVITVTTTGGMVANDPTALGAQLDQTLPSASSAPSVTAYQCYIAQDLIHLDMTWNVGDNTTEFFLEAVYLDSGGDAIASTVRGPYLVAPGVTTMSVSDDFPDNDDAASIRLRTQAYNEDVGPIPSPTTTWANACAS